MAGSLFQLPVVLATDPVNGVPLSGGKLYFYENNTSTPKDTYTTSDLSTPHTHPVIADSGGYFPEIWLDGTYSWKLTDSDDVQIDEGDDLSGIISALISNVFQRVNTFDGGIIVDPEHATDSGTDAYVSATNTSAPGNGKTITRDFQSASTTITPELDGIVCTTKDGSALWAGALSGVHELQLASGGGSWLVLDPNPTSDSAETADDAVAALGAFGIATGELSGTGIPGAIGSGSIVEFGSNSDGFYWRWSSGLQLCVANLTLTFDASSRLRNSWTFPASFTSPPSPIVGHFPGSTTSATPSAGEISYAPVSTITTTSADLDILRNTGATDFQGGDTVDTRAIAVGNWK